jgi:hypothetical protein
VKSVLIAFSLGRRGHYSKPAANHAVCQKTRLQKNAWRRFISHHVHGTEYRCGGLPAYRVSASSRIPQRDEYREASGVPMRSISGLPRRMTRPRCARCRVPHYRELPVLLDAFAEARASYRALTTRAPVALPPLTRRSDASRSPQPFATVHSSSPPPARCAPEHWFHLGPGREFLGLRPGSPWKWTVKHGAGHWRNLVGRS